MADDAGRSRLGRGLASLIGDVGVEAAPSGERYRQRRMPVEFLKPNPRNPRRIFSESELNELSESIRARGVIQPIVVRAIPETADSFEIVAGERRWRAAQRAGIHDVPVVIIEANDGQALELAIIENVQRADLNALEEAMGYRALADQYSYSQEDIAKTVGKSRSHVANTLRLLNLPESVQAYINAGKLSAGHARALLGNPDAERIAKEIVERGLNVRQVESLAQEKSGRAGKSTRPRRQIQKDPDTIVLEKRISDALGLAVSVDHHGEGGILHIEYLNLDQLDEILRRLGRD